MENMPGLIYHTTFYIEDLNPVSLNNAYTTSSSHYKIKSPKTQKWLYRLKMLLKKDQKKVDEIKAKFDRNNHYLLVNYVWFLPRSKILRQKGGLSERSGDWSNISKIPDDLIFNTVLGIDDSMICTGRIDKFLSQNDKYCLKLRIQVRMLSELRERSEREWHQVWTKDSTEISRTS